MSTPKMDELIVVIGNTSRKLTATELALKKAYEEVKRLSAEYDELQTALTNQSAELLREAKGDSNGT